MNKIKILITGAGGQLAKCLIDELKNNKNITYNAFLSNELNITDPFAVKQKLGEIYYDYLVNCAASTNVPKCEMNEEYGLLGNGYALKNLAEFCKEYNTKLIHISTDYVFDGTSNVKFEDAEPNPINRYGRSKYLGEQEIIKVKDLEYIILRTSWLYSEYGNNFVKTILSKIQNKEVPSVVCDQIGSPTYARDLAKTIIIIIESSLKDDYKFKSNIYNYSNQGIISWYDFATAILDIYDWNRDTGVECINPILSIDYDSSVNRPAVSILPKNKILTDYPDVRAPYWRDSLKIAILNLTK